MKQISILGCGWLGFPLAKALIRLGFAVKGATTSASKLGVLEDEGIIPFQVAVAVEGISGNMVSFLENSDILILNIPPQVKTYEKGAFVAKMRHVIAAVEPSSVSKILFVSSTSVYADDNQIITEEMLPEPDSESGKQLVEVEKLLQGNTKFQTTIVRFGGLIGNNRHPVKFLAGRKDVENPDAPINLIHLEDCIGVIQKILEKGIWNETFNAVTPFHPTRKNYYTQKALALQLDLPEFRSGGISNGKTIVSDKVSTLLDYTFSQKEL